MSPLGKRLLLTGAVAVLVFGCYVQLAPAPLAAAFTALVILLGTVWFTPRAAWRTWFPRHWWLPYALGVASGPFWWWYAGYAGPPDKAFFEIAAQVLPVLLLASLVDVRGTRTLPGGALAAAVTVVSLGEISALHAVGFEAATETNFAFVTAAFVTAALALVFGLLAEE